MTKLIYKFEGQSRRIVSTFWVSVRLYASARELLCRPEGYGALLERRAGMASCPVAELAVMLVTRGTVAAVDVGTAGVVEKEAGVVAW